MNKLRLSMGIVGAGFSYLGALAACADSNERTLIDGPSEAGVVVPEAGEAAADSDPNPVIDAGGDVATRRCSDDSLCHTDLPGGQVLRDVWGDGSGTVWAVSDSGSILGGTVPHRTFTPRAVAQLISPSGAAARPTSGWVERTASCTARRKPTTLGLH